MKWEEEGGRRAEFLSALRLFTHLFGRDWDPANFDPIDAASPTPPSWMSAPAQIESYRQAHELFNLFERLTAEDVGA
jgi:hypothetical protein